jgi:hypothetical protein
MIEEGPKSAQDHPANGRDDKTFGPARAGSPGREPGYHAPSKDIEGLVRQALSQHLMRSPYFPPTLARTLATDIAAVQTTNGAEGAAGNGHSTDDCRSDETGLTLSTLWNQVKNSSTVLRVQLIERHGLPAALADELVMHGQEGALTSLMASGFPRAEIEALAEQLSKEEVLTPTLLLRSLCLGELMFFESAMAALSATSVDRVHTLMYDDGPPGFLKLYELAHLPLGLYRAFRATVEVIQQLRRETARHWRSDFTDQIIARLVKEYEQVCPEDLEHVLSQLSRQLEEAPPLAEIHFHATV